MQSYSIHIQHLDARYRVSKSLDNPSSFQCRLDQIVTDLLARVWENRIAHAGGDDAIYFIESMEVNLILDPSRSDDRALAETWARTLHEGVLRTLSRGGSGIIIFHDRGEYVASFLEDLLQGRAWERWYYSEFEHLRSLSFGQAALKVLSDDGDIGRDALIELTRRGDLDLLLAGLIDAEVEAIVSRCLLPPGPRVILPNTIPYWVRAIRSFITDRGFVLSSVLSRDVARLYLFLLREHPELGPNVNLARFIHDLLRLRQAIMQSRDLNSFLALVNSENWNAALSQLGRGIGQQLLATLIREITGPETVALLKSLQVEAQPLVARRMFTLYGGIFLLAPTIAEMKLHDFLQPSSYPEFQDTSKDKLFLFMIALQCLGRRNIEQAQHDGGLTLFAGLSSPPTSAQIEQYTQALTPEIHRAFSEAFQSHQVKVSKLHPAVFMPRVISSERRDDLGEFSLYSETEPFLPDCEWDLTLSIVSSSVFRWFASRLGAFAESSPEYIRRNFLESQAEIDVFANRIAVRFLTCPLQMVLRMAGFNHTTWKVPWLEGRELEFQFD